MCALLFTNIDVMTAATDSGMPWISAGIVCSTVNSEIQQTGLSGWEDEDMTQGYSEPPGVTWSHSSRGKGWHRGAHDLLDALSQ